MFEGIIGSGEAEGAWIFEGGTALGEFFVFEGGTALGEFLVFEGGTALGEVFVFEESVVFVAACVLELAIDNGDEAPTTGDIIYDNDNAEDADMRPFIYL